MKEKKEADRDSNAVPAAETGEEPAAETGDKPAADAGEKPAADTGRDSAGKDEESPDAKDADKLSGKKHPRTGMTAGGFGTGRLLGGPGPVIPKKRRESET